MPLSPDDNREGLRNPSEAYLAIFLNSQGHSLRGHPHYDCGPYQAAWVPTWLINILSWICKQPNSTERPTVVFCHENAGSNLNPDS